MTNYSVVAFALTMSAVTLLLWLAPPPKDPAVALTTSSSAITAGNYDTLESPRGSAYMAPEDKGLYIIAWTGNPHVNPSTDFTLEIGYGDTVVSNSSSAPTGATVVYAVTWRSADGHAEPREAWIPIPSGKYAFIRPVGAAGAFSAVGNVH